MQFYASNEEQKKTTLVLKCKRISVPVANNNINCQNAFVTAHIVSISSEHLDSGDPKGLNSTENKTGPYGSHVSSSHDPPGLISHPA